jgi:hypothetical protein
LWEDTILKTEKKKKGEESIKMFTREMGFGHGGADYRRTSTVIVVDCVEILCFILNL